MRKRQRGRQGSAEATERRRDDKGIAWRKAEVEVALAGIVAEAGGGSAAAIKRSSRFDDRGLGWDDWYKLSLVKPVRKQLHVLLSHTVVKNDVRTFGDLADYVWSLMEPI